MAWPKNNRYWKNVKVFQELKFTKETLWDVFIKYIEDNEKQEWYKTDFIKSGPDAGKLIDVPIPNPPSIQGFCAFAGMTPQCFTNYRKSEHELFEISSMIVNIIQTIQIEGATVNVYNQAIIARLTGLVDKSEVEIKAELSDDEIEDKIKSILALAKK